ncbi:MAG: polysaccharide biosynthesis/export family protein [Candidatus Saganbacteria bacterium]|nr:polysaccharide biosynthesis/export family protein [Candidatus Saganbacteria bacterium]
MRKKAIKFIAAIAAFCFSANAMPCFAQDYAGSNAPSPANYQSQYLYSQQEMKVYKLTPGDSIELAIIVGDNAKSLDYKFIISPMGEIYIPNIGLVDIMGLSIEDARAKIDKEIKKYFKEPFRSYLVLVQPKITRLKMQGDAITIPYTQRYVYVYGEVADPGRFGFLPGSKLSDYFNFAGGPTGRANLSYVSVARNVEGKPQVFNVNANDLIYKGVKDNDVVIQAGDIIKVPANFFYFSDFATFVNTILLGITLYYTVQNFIKR